MSDKIVEMFDALGKKFPLNIDALITVDFIPLIGGTLIIKGIDTDVPPIACGNKPCDDLAEYWVMAVSHHGESSDCQTCLCPEHLNEVIELGHIECPYEITH